MHRADTPWGTLTLDDIIAQAAGMASDYQGLSLFTKLLFHALHARGWDGCLLEQEVISGRSGFQFHFLRWHGKTLNLKGENVPTTLSNLQVRREGTLGLDRVITTPDADIVDLVQSLPEDYARTQALVDAMFLAQATPSAAAPCPPPRL